VKSRPISGATAKRARKLLPAELAKRRLFKLMRSLEAKGRELDGHQNLPKVPSIGEYRRIVAGCSPSGPVLSGRGS
jgi:hypothetical protein